MARLRHGLGAARAELVVDPPRVHSEHDVSPDLEAKRLGNLGVKAIVDLLLSDAHAEEAPA